MENFDYQATAEDAKNEYLNFFLSAARSPITNYSLQAAGLFTPDMLEVSHKAKGTSSMYGGTRQAPVRTPLQRANYSTSIKASPRFAKLALPVNAAFGLADYAIGKAEGEDDIRAASGAVGSTVGGAIGGTIGTLLGRNKAAAMLGATAGNFAGGWLADRADELIRGQR